jgi:uncharacterized protein (DUF1810 family)
MNAHFGNAFTDGGAISEMASLCRLEPVENSRLGLPVPQLAKPALELIRLLEQRHETIVASWLQFVKKEEILMDMDDFDLDRFISAQDGVFDTALSELQAGRKRSHWMWFIFPQMRGLGISSTAFKYGIVSLDEAKAYLAHPVLGERLRHCTQAVLDVNGRSLHEIFGSPDDMKFGSSMTLFASADGQLASVFHQAIDRYCGGRMDQRTLDLLQHPES